MLMLWLKSKAVPLTATLIAVLLVALLSVSALYALKSKDYEAKALEVATVSQELTSLKTQIEDEKQRSALLNNQITTAKSNLQKKINELEALKKDKAKKESIKKNPSVYELETQKSLDDYMNRMSCISGNLTLCTKP